jgi:threonyl-tRNA synthetase
MEHRYLEVARRMNLFCLGDAAGVVYWKPSGLLLYEKLKAFIRSVHRKYGYAEVRSPSIVNVGLFERSGHLAKYRENMFFLNQLPDDVEAHAYVFRPMSCPNHMVLYQAELRSYRDLPVKFFEFGEVARNEPAGSLQALMRSRQFVQDDVHIFSSPRNIKEALSHYLEMAAEVYKKLGFNGLNIAISLRPSERFGSDAEWDAAEEHLREACRQNGLAWDELPGEGAFYGPKIELQVQDALGRKWQLGTLQLDYVLPGRFGLKFINEEGVAEQPVMIHHAVLGSLERMIGILLELFGAELPSFLQPHEAVVLPVSDKFSAYARKCHRALVQQWPDALVDDSPEPLGARIRRWKLRGVPHILVVGEKEAEKAAHSDDLFVSANNQSKPLKGWIQEVAA